MQHEQEVKKGQIHFILFVGLVNVVDVSNPPSPLCLYMPQAQQVAYAQFVLALVQSKREKQMIVLMWDLSLKKAYSYWTWSWFKLSQV